MAAAAPLPGPTSTPAAQRLQRQTGMPAARAASSAGCRPWCTVPLPVAATTRPCTPAATKACTPAPRAPAWLVMISTQGQAQASPASRPSPSAVPAGQG